MEVPKKIYIIIDPYWGSIYVNYDKNDPDNIEYIHKDTFIENAKKWFNSKNGIVITDTKAFFDEFIDYIGIG